MRCPSRILEGRSVSHGGERTIANDEFAAGLRHECDRTVLLGFQEQQLADHFVGKLLVVPFQRGGFHVHALSGIHAHAIAHHTGSRFQVAPPRITTAQHPQTVAWHETVVFASVDEYHLVLGHEHQRHQAGEYARPDLSLILLGRHYLELPPNRTDFCATLDDVERLDDASARDALFLVELIDANGADDLHH